MFLGTELWCGRPCSAGPYVSVGAWTKGTCEYYSNGTNPAVGIFSYDPSRVESKMNTEKSDHQKHIPFLHAHDILKRGYLLVVCRDMSLVRRTGCRHIVEGLHSVHESKQAQMLPESSTTRSYIVTSQWYMQRLCNWDLRKMRSVLVTECGFT